MDYLWHKTSIMLPSKDGNAVVGLWNQHDCIVIALCYYDYESKKWQSAEAENDMLHGTFMRNPDYWIETPKPNKKNMDCKAIRHWHIILAGDGCPDTNDTVVGVWISGSETYAELCKYNPDSKEWISMNPDTKGDAVREPDYWIEYPD